MLVDGVRTAHWHPARSKDAQGRFICRQSAFRNRITPDGAPGPTGGGGLAAEAGRERLRVAPICPRAARTLIARRLRGLDGLLPVRAADPALTARGRAFGGHPGADADPRFGAACLHGLRARAGPRHSGRATPPAPWDERSGTMMSNGNHDIPRMFHAAVAEPALARPRPCREDLRAEIEAPAAAIRGRPPAPRRADAVRCGRSPAVRDRPRRIAGYPRLAAFMARVPACRGGRDTADLGHAKAGSRRSARTTRPGSCRRAPITPRHCWPPR